MHEGNSNAQFTYAQKWAMQWTILYTPHMKNEK